MALKHAMAAIFDNWHSERLTLSFDHRILKLDEYMAREGAQNHPTITLPSNTSLTQVSKYLAICVDVSAPFPSTPIFSPILHWIQAGLHVDPVISHDELWISIPPLVDFVAPRPPPMSMPHRYVVLLYEEPEGYTTERGRKALGLKEDEDSLSTWGRIRWDFEGWARAIGLDTKKVLAGGAWRSM